MCMVTSQHYPPCDTTLTNEYNLQAASNLNDDYMMPGWCTLRLLLVATPGERPDGPAASPLPPKMLLPVITPPEKPPPPPPTPSVAAAPALAAALAAASLRAAWSTSTHTKRCVSGCRCTAQTVSAAAVPSARHCTACAVALARLCAEWQPLSANPVVTPSRSRLRENQHKG